MSGDDNQDARPSARRATNRPKTRTLVRWDDDKDKQVLLMVQYVCNMEGIRIPWDKVAQGLGPGFTDGAIVQHLAKLRLRMAELGFPVPPPLRRGATQAPSRVYAGVNRGGPPRMMTIPRLAQSNKKRSTKDEGQRSKVYDDDSENGSPDDAPEDTPKAKSKAKKGAPANPKARRGKTGVIDSIEIKEEDDDEMPRRSSTRVARKDYSKMVNKDPDEEDFASGETTESDEGFPTFTSDDDDDDDVEDAKKNEDVEDVNDPNATEEDNRVKTEPTESASADIDTRPRKVVKLTIPKAKSPVAPDNSYAQFDATMPNTPSGLPMDMSGFDVGDTQLSGGAYETNVAEEFARAYAPAALGHDYGNPSSWGVNAYTSPQGLVNNPLGDNASLAPRGYSSFSTDATTSTGMNTAMGTTEAIYDTAGAVPYTGNFGFENFGSYGHELHGLPDPELTRGEFNDFFEENEEGGVDETFGPM